MDLGSSRMDPGSSKMDIGSFKMSLGRSKMDLGRSKMEGKGFRKASEEPNIAEIAFRRIQFC